MVVFDGETYNPAQDQQRLGSQLERVKAVLSDHKWHTPSELVALCGGTDASVTARCRDLRKERFGAHTIERRRVAQGLWEYRWLLDCKCTMCRWEPDA